MDGDSDPGGGVKERLEKGLEFLRRYLTESSSYLADDLVVAGKPLKS